MEVKKLSSSSSSSSKASTGSSGVGSLGSAVVAGSEATASEARADGLDMILFGRDFVMGVIVINRSCNERRKSLYYIVKSGRSRK